MYWQYHLAMILHIIMLICLIATGTTTFTESFDTQPDRVWIGSDWHANRLQDWQIADGRLLCVEASRRLPVRTAHHLTHRIPSGQVNGFEASVTTGTIDADAASATNAFSGFLIGTGNDVIDYRLSAMAHHVPAKDGGALAVVDHGGLPTLRSFEGPFGDTPLWSISSPVGLADVPELDAQTTSRSGDGFGDGPRRPVTLTVQVTPSTSFTGTAHVHCIVTDVGTGDILSTVTYDGVDPSAVDGAVSLVSHHGPKESTLGHWFDDLTLSGPGLVESPGHAFGPIFSALYTLSDSTLNMTAQLPPLASTDSRRVAFQVPLTATTWRTIATAPIVRDSWTATFHIPNWNAAMETPYRLMWIERANDGVDTPAYYAGTIRAEPSSDETFVLGALTCHKTYTGGLQWNENGLWFPHVDIRDGVAAHDPDMLYFSGDQIYEGDLTPAHQKTPDNYILDYLYKWTHWCWAFSDLTRDRPCVTIPDDHDVYHGNLWGAGGRKAVATDGHSAQDSGGYRQPPRFVNTVHRTQTSHLPAPADPTPVEQNISVYYTDMDYGGISFAILHDRQFKDSASVMVPAGKVKNGWFTAAGFNPATDGDNPAAPLLGDRQEAFLHEWAIESRPTWTNVILSQSPFACVQTLPSGKRGGSQRSITMLPLGEVAKDVKSADADSNGWPQTARDRAVALLNEAGALHITGDQHLAFVVRYGIDDYGDSGYVFCTPAIANTWPRRWMPTEAGANRNADSPTYTGDFVDGFGNLITVLAVANPHQYGHEPAALHDRAPGYGIVRFNRQSRAVTLECWPRSAPPNAPDSDQYEGWPITIPSSH